MTMPACKFTFDDSPEFNGFSHGSTWNGFDNVAVTPAERDKIVTWLRDVTPTGGDDGDNGVADIMSIAPMTDGLISLGWGYCTSVVRPQGDPALIASRFVTILSTWLSPGEWLEMKRRNALQTNPLICHSHDFCDANMAMLEAYESVTGKAPDADNEAQADLWCKAWNLAMPALTGEKP